MTCRSLVLCIALVSITPAFAAGIAPTAPKTTTSTTSTTSPAPKSRLANRLLLIQPRDFNFSSDDFYIAARQRELPKLLASGGGDDDLGDWLVAQSVNSSDQFQII